MISRTANENWPGAWNMAFAIHRHRLIVRRACECAVLLGTTFLLFCLMAAAWTAPLPPNQNSLRIYFVDVEGGQATLFVTPTGRSLLIDTGWPGNDGRDADRIVAAARKAGVSNIDFVLVTHFHSHYVGGAPQLAARIPISTFIDHGENWENNDAPTVQVWQAYEQLLATQKYKRITAKPGDTLPIQGMEATVISSDGALIGAPLPGAGQDNPKCKDAEHFPPDQTENLSSLGVLITFGKLRILHLGDPTRDKEAELVCPRNKLGLIDIFVVSHHGW